MLVVCVVKLLDVFVPSLCRMEGAGFQAACGESALKSIRTSHNSRHASTGHFVPVRITWQITFFIVSNLRSSKSTVFYLQVTANGQS